MKTLMAPSTVQESVTVTGEAPLVDTTTSTLGGNIDKRQMQDLPINGRNWMDLAMLAPGSRQNESSNIPQARQGYSQINIDGQQITHLIPGTDQNQPSYSMDAIAEFVVVTNRFDATQGRSSGMLANAVTKSGTNTYAGTVAGYFRSDRFNASDFIQNRVVPYQDQQIVTTFGGPVRKDRIHFFGNYEQERQPQTVTFSSPYPAFNVDLAARNRQRKGIVRGDAQISAETHVMTRFQKYYNDLPNSGTGGATSHPSTARREQRHSNELFSTLTQVVGTRAVNEIKGGASLFNYTRDAAVTWKGGCFPDAPVRCGGSKVVSLRSYSIGQAVGQDQTQNNYSIRDDYTFSFDKLGRQDVKVGGEYIRQQTLILWCASCTGNLDATNGAVPAGIESLFPVWNDASTWNLAPLSPISRRFTMNVSNTNFHYKIPQSLYAAWLQDDWKVASRLTLNLGVRYDVQAGANSEGYVFAPWINNDIPYDLNNVGPRAGFAYTLDDRTVIRGGYGLFYSQASTDEGHQTAEAVHQAAAEALYDGRADFAINPYNGPTPTYAQVMANACDQSGNTPGCYRRSITDEINSTWRRMPYARFSDRVVNAFERKWIFSAERPDRPWDDVITQEHIVKILSKQKELNFKPGDEYSYCNSNFTLLAEIVKSISGQSLRKFTDSAIFKPLGMDNTHFHDDYTEIVKNRAYSYSKKDSAHFENDVLSYSNVGATSLFTNVNDMSKWIINFYDHKVGDQKDIDLLTEKGKLNNGKEISYALGIVSDKYNGWKQFQHSGGDAGAGGGGRPRAVGRGRDAGQGSDKKRTKKRVVRS